MDDGPRWGVALLNMGGPATTADVQGFLERLLSDPYVTGIPVGGLRRWVARRVAKKRAPLTIPRYQAIGGGSPIRPQTEAQAQALSLALEGLPVAAAMRYSAPSADEAAQKLAAAGATHVVALPLYPQYCRATSETSQLDFKRAAAARGLAVREVRSYPALEGFIEAISENIHAILPHLMNPVVIFSAHGLPERMAKKGDPYPGEIHATVRALAARLPAGVPHKLAFQSRLGPVKWLGPYLDEVVRRVATGGQQDVMVVPISFVSEHIETLHELDVEVRAIAEEAGVRRFVRVPTVQTHPAFIAGLAELASRAIETAQAGGAS